ncbi:hypothetical protein BDL97_01G114600 [Sphagnum fallax]|nr:hypothetical protein BDL97_01G114600 [Sphagnum fallax]
MGTVPPGLLSWQPHSLTLLSHSSEKSPLRTLPKRLPNVRHFIRANTTGLIVLQQQQQQLSVSKLNGVSQVQSERRRRLKERRCDGPEWVLREYTLHSNSFNSSTNWYGNGVQQQLLHRKISHRQPAVVCRAAGDGAVFSSDLGTNNSYESQAKLGGNGAATQKEKLTFKEQVLKIWEIMLSLLPNGSWWDVMEKGQYQQGYGITFLGAMKRLWILISPDRLVIAAAFTALIVAALSEITIPHYVAAAIFAAQSGLTDEFYRNSQLLAIMSCTYGLFSGIRGACFGVANQILVRRMREKLFTTLLNQDIAFYDAEAVGALTSRLGSDCQQVSQIIGTDLNIMFRNALQGIGAFLYLVVLSWQMALTTLAICSIMWYFMQIYGRYQKKTAKAAQDSVASANEVAEETLSQLRVVRTFGTEKEELNRYSKWLNRLVDISFRQSVAHGFWGWSSNTLYNATQVVALMMGGGFVMTGKITPEQLTKFILYSEWVVHSTWWVGNHWSSLMQAIGASEKVFQLLDLPPSKQLSMHGIKLPKVEGCVQFAEITFSYPTRPQAYVLQNVSLSLYPGELVAVVGLSGSGKSTLVGLLLRHYEPCSGQILIDGVPLTSLDIKWFRQQVGVVNQEPRLFSMDIASNIAYGCGRKVSHMEVERAAKQANAHDFIMSLPEGYKTLVDNSRLSGGQKQRIAIARALMRDPSILILDEATSALDAESEHSVQRALDSAMRGDGNCKRTVLVIAHRLSTVRAANRIVVMKHGQIAEMGSHDELLRKGGEYAKLTKRQQTILTQ